ncbi:MAG: hypothetical protein NWE88_05135 [Candidatus Bathyarchaeota archaeon]|nr:hypothetical protein [Candidatus Bathyarchaeota archaeon]
MGLGGREAEGHDFAAFTVEINERIAEFERKVGELKRQKKESSRFSFSSFDPVICLQA